jgi:hypothetical protein
MNSARDVLDERFDAGRLDLDVWFPHHLPHWSSRAASGATWSIDDEGLHLTIPPEQPRWCPDLHPVPLRVSCLQSGSFAGPVGSTIGQQPFRDDLVVREEQPTMWGYTPCYGRIEVRMRGVVSERSMFAWYLSGIEDLPERSGEICVAEIFGNAITAEGAEVGMGIKALRDPALDPRCPSSWSATCAASRWADSVLCERTARCSAHSLTQNGRPAAPSGRRAAPRTHQLVRALTQNV